MSDKSPREHARAPTSLRQASGALKHSKTRARRIFPRYCKGISTLDGASVEHTLGSEKLQEDLFAVSNGNVRGREIPSVFTEPLVLDP